jgi:hypothetical protein
MECNLPWNITEFSRQQRTPIGGWRNVAVRDFEVILIAFEARTGLHGAQRRPCKTGNKKAKTFVRIHLGGRSPSIFTATTNANWDPLAMMNNLKTIEHVKFWLLAGGGKFKCAQGGVAQGGNMCCSSASLHDARYLSFSKQNFLVQFNRIVSSGRANLRGPVTADHWSVSNYNHK